MMLRGRARVAGPADRGQASLEIALLLPALAMALLAVIQIGLVVHARVMVTHAAREAVRAAAVGQPLSEARSVAIASGGLAPQRLEVSLTEAGDQVTATIRYRAPTSVPIVGAFVGDVELVGDATMRIEQ